MFSKLHQHPFSCFSVVQSFSSTSSLQSLFLSLSPFPLSFSLSFQDVSRKDFPALSDFYFFVPHFLFLLVFRPSLLPSVILVF